MDYRLKYLCLFDPISNIGASPIYTLEILEKGYSGTIYKVKGGAVPVLHQCDTDDPKAPIKGSSLTISLINEGGLLPLSSFFSTDDDTFKVRFSCLNQMLFEGFIVQDDCSEIIVDYTHEISLSANDNLGLLKDVSLDKANIFTLSYSSDPGFVFGYFGTRAFLLNGFGIFPGENILPGDKIQFGSPVFGPSIDGQYTVNKTVVSSGNLLIYVDEPVAIDSFGEYSYQIYSPASLYDKKPLSTILRMCLSVTGLLLNTNVYCKIKEITQDPAICFLDQTLVDIQTFLKDDTSYKDCYEVLFEILQGFGMTLCQALGEWNIIRWDELRYFDNKIEGFSYDELFVPRLLTTVLPDIKQAGVGDYLQAETGLLQRINRPLLFDKKTFNYQYPRQLLRNFDLKQLGSLIRSYTTGTGINLKKISEYNVPWWYASTLLLSVAGNYFIRITTDDLDNEIERVLVVNGDAVSYPIEANAGDSFKFSFSFRTEDSQPGNVTIQCFVSITDGITTNRFMNPALTPGTNMWRPTGAFAYQIPSGDNTNQWHTVEIDCTRWPVPFDGLLTVYLRVADLSGTKHETYYKDIRFDYTARINESTKIIGQTHQTSQSGVIKNTQDTEIFIDSSPRNAISGTLFLNQKIGVLQRRTTKWQHPYIAGQSKNLGDLMTFEEMFWRKKPRTILEGTLYGVIQVSNYISLLSVLKSNFFPDLNFVFGKLEIDYKNNKLDGTLWEIWQDGETDDNIASYYKFDYLYSTD